MATIAVDFDGTIVTHEYPKIGREIPFAIETLKMLIRDQHRLILWSVREGELLQEAVDWCKERGVEFWAVNKDYPEESYENNNHFSRKLKADFFIDDRNIGGLPDWGQIYQIISQGKSYRALTSSIIFRHKSLVMAIVGEMLNLYCLPIERKLYTTLWRLLFICSVSLFTSMYKDKSFLLKCSNLSSETVESTKRR